MRLSLLFLLVTGSFYFKAKANDSALISHLINDIAKMQYDEEGKYNFHKGMFYGYKKYAGFTQRITPDNNIFFTSLIAFSLKNMLPYLSDDNRITCEKIVAKATNAYPYYQNKNKLPSYFFWQPGVRNLPNTYLLQYLTKYIATSEDIDDTVMILMAMSAPDSFVQKLKLMMDAVANGKLRRIKNTYKKYRDIPAHSTYLGYKWNVDFDFGVHCNIMYFLLENKLPFNKYDSATVTLLQQMIHAREYIKHPHFISPYYIKTQVILYHLARLMGRFTIPALEPYRQQIIDDINQQLNKSNNIMDDIILSTSLLRLGVQAPSLPIYSIEDFNNSNQGKFAFYGARAASQFDNPFKKLFINFNMLNYYFFCPAYNKVLLLEYLIEKEKTVRYMK